MMKKWISLLLCAALLLQGMVLYAFAEDDALPFIVATDLHFVPTPSATSVTFPGDKYYCADNANTLVTESGAIIRQFLREAAQSEAKFVLLCGDLADHGTISEHEGMAAMLDAFEQETGKKVFVINGNHDFNARIPVERFKQLYQPFGYGEALEIDAATCSYTAELDSRYRLLALDSCNHINWIR